MEQALDFLTLSSRSALILARLDEDWCSYEELSQRTGKQERTLRRDLDRLRSSGVQIESRWNGLQKVFRIKPGTRRYPIEPGILEVIAANLGRGLLAFLNGTELREEMENLFRKLRLSSRASERQLHDLERKFWFMPDAPRDYGGCDEILNELITCLIDQKLAIVEYQGRGQIPEEIRLRPYTLIVRRECLYLLARPESASRPESRGGIERAARTESASGSESAGRKRNASRSDRSETAPLPRFRLLDVTRIHRCRRLRESFELPRDFDPAEMFDESFGVFLPRAGEEGAVDVKIWFEAGVGRSIKGRCWHDSQRWRTSPEGGWLLEMHVRVCPELVHWLLGFGPTARAMAPESLVRGVKAELEQAVALYRGLPFQCF